MVLGFNHNIMYKGEMFHIQTEDSGVKNPNIVTLLYRGGTIIASRKTSYADILKIEKLEQVVEELMKEQHKEMLRSLKAGAFDDRAFGKQMTPVASDIVDKTPVTPSPAPVTAPPQQPPAEAKQNAKNLDEIILDFLVSGENK